MDIHGATKADIPMNSYMDRMVSESPTMNMPMDGNLDIIITIMGIEADADVVVVLGEGLRNTE